MTVVRFVLAVAAVTFALATYFHIRGEGVPHGPRCVTSPTRTESRPDGTVWRSTFSNCEVP